MKYFLTACIIPLVLTSCEVPDYQVPSMGKEKGESDLYEEQEALGDAKANVVNANNNVYKPKPKKQDPLKSYEENSDGIIQSQAKHPYPSENPF